MHAPAPEYGGHHPAYQAHSATNRANPWNRCQHGRFGLHCNHRGGSAHAVHALRIRRLSMDDAGFHQDGVRRRSYDRTGLGAMAIVG